MKELNDQTYRESLKSVNSDFDKTLLWDNIEQELDAKETDKRMNYLIFFGIGIVIISLISLLYSASSKTTTQIHSFDEKQEQVVNTKETYDETLSSKTIIQEDIVKTTEVISDNSSKSTDQIANVSSKKQNYLPEQNGVNNPPARNSILSPVNNSYLRKNFSNETSSNILTINNEQILAASIQALRQNFKALSDLQLIKRLPLKSFDSELKTESLFPEDLAPLNLGHEDKNLKTHRLSIMATLGKPQSKYTSDNQAYKAWADSSQRASTDLYDLGLMVSYSRDITPRLSLTGGLDIRRTSERFNIVQEEITSTEIPSDSATYIINLQGQQQFYSGELTEYSNTITTVQHFNHYYTMGLTLGMRYSQPLSRKWSAFVDGTVIYNPIQISTGRSIDNNLQLVSLKNNTASNLTQVRAITGFNYNYNDRINYQLGIMWTSDLTSRYNSEDIVANKQILSLNLGVSYNLK